MDNLRQEEMSFQLAVRGILFALPYPVKRKDSDNHFIHECMEQSYSE